MFACEFGIDVSPRGGDRMLNLTHCREKRNHSFSGPRSLLVLSIAPVLLFQLPSYWPILPVCLDEQTQNASKLRFEVSRGRSNTPRNVVSRICCRLAASATLRSQSSRGRRLDRAAASASLFASQMWPFPPSSRSAYECEMMCLGHASLLVLSLSHPTKNQPIPSHSASEPCA